MPSFVSIRNLVLLPLLTTALIAGLTLVAPASNASGYTRAQRISKAVRVALHQQGDHYRYGAAGPKAFDCSGLMQYSFRRAGLTIPRTSRDQAKRAHRIAKKNLRRGDLMFFTNGGRVYHAAMYIGRSKGKIRMLHAPGTGKRVRIDHPWTNEWFAATLRR
jgi:cell wall-associated NlpC family hydrolase